MILLNCFKFYCRLNRYFILTFKPQSTFQARKRHSVQRGLCTSEAHHSHVCMIRFQQWPCQYFMSYFLNFPNCYSFLQTQNTFPHIIYKSSQNCVIPWHSQFLSMKSDNVPSHIIQMQPHSQPGHKAEMHFKETGTPHSPTLRA